MQFAEAKQLQRESAQRLNGFMDELRGGGKVDLSAKNLGEEGCAYVVEALAFNDRWVALGAPDALAHAEPRPPETLRERYAHVMERRANQVARDSWCCQMLCSLLKQTCIHLIIRACVLTPVTVCAGVQQQT